MPLSQDDPALDYGGSWAVASQDWPRICFASKEEAAKAYYLAWKHVKIPYGSYVLVEKTLRLETEEHKQAVLSYLASLEEVGEVEQGEGNTLTLCSSADSFRGEPSKENEK